MHPNPVPRVVGRIRRRHPVQVRDVKFLRTNTDRMIKMTVPGAFTMAQQAQNDFYKDEVELAMDYATAVNEEIKELFAAGADVVQIDEPYLQARPAIEGITGTTAVHVCFGYAAIIHQRPSAYSFLPELEAADVQQNFDRNCTIAPRLQSARGAVIKDHPTRGPGSRGYDRGDAGDRGRPHPARAGVCRSNQDRRSARLWSEISAA